MRSADTSKCSDQYWTKAQIEQTYTSRPKFITTVVVFVEAKNKSKFNVQNSFPLWTKMYDDSDKCNGILFSKCLLMFVRMMVVKSYQSTAKKKESVLEYGEGKSIISLNIDVRFS